MEKKTAVDLDRIERFVERMREMGAMQVAVEGVTVTFGDLPVPRPEAPTSMPVVDTSGPEEVLDMSPGPGSDREREAVRRRVLAELQESLP